MTPGERAVWAAVYAAHVHSPQVRGFEQPTPDALAFGAATAAKVEIERLRKLVDDGPAGNPVVEQVREVLR